MTEEFETIRVTVPDEETPAVEVTVIKDSDDYYVQLDVRDGESGAALWLTTEQTSDVEAALWSARQTIDSLKDQKA